MPSESSCDLKPVSKAVTHIGVPPPEPEQLKCPRCESMNTKFCYYNNYNFSQPRHFCKGCRRYWTHGGTLRDIPVGGGSRKNAKRSRTMASSGATSPGGAYDYRRVSSPAPLSALPVGNLPIMAAAADGKHGGLCGNFSSLLGTHAPAFFNLNGFGLGLQTGSHDDMGFGLGRSTWPFVGGLTIPDGGAAVGGGGGPSMMPNAWQLQASEGGLLGGDCFGLSDHIGFARTGHALN